MGRDAGKRLDRSVAAPARRVWSDDELAVIDELLERTPVYDVGTLR